MDEGIDQLPWKFKELYLLFQQDCWEVNPLLPFPTNNEYHVFQLIGKDDQSKFCKQEIFKD